MKSYRAYYRQEGGSLTIGQAHLMDDGQMVNAAGGPIEPDNETVQLRGWADSKAQSYDHGRVLIAINH